MDKRRRRVGSHGDRNHDRVQLVEQRWVCIKISDQQGPLKSDRHELRQLRKRDRRSVRCRRTVPKLAEQAGLLVVQEQRLATERAEMRRKLEAWDSERFGLKQEIRRLLREPARAA